MNNRAALMICFKTVLKPTEWKLLIIEPIFSTKIKSNKIKTENKGWNLVVLLESRQ
jgi:hypothetical protein